MKKPIKIWLKHKQEPICLRVTDEQIMDFTDWANKNFQEDMHKQMFVFDFGNDKHFIVFRSHLQAFEI